MTIVAPRGAVPPPDGVSFTTTPLLDWSLTGHDAVSTANPAACRSFVACDCDSPLTSGTAVAGAGCVPADTCRRSRAPTVEFATTTPFGLLEAIHTTITCWRP